MAPVREIAEAWSALYSGSAALRSAIAFAHVGGLLSAGGCAVASDLGMLRALGRGPAAVRAELDRLNAVHRIVIAGLAVVIVSGVLLMLADLDAFLESRVFWIKMGLVLGLLVNGAVLVRVCRPALQGEPRARVRIMTAASITLWFLTTLLGTVLPNAL